MFCKLEISVLFARQSQRGSEVRCRLPWGSEKGVSSGSERAGVVVSGGRVRVYSLVCLKSSSLRVRNETNFVC